MRTLDNWMPRLASAPSIIECPRMQLIGRDHEPPIFAGPGHIDINSSTDFGFTVFAKSLIGMEAFHRLVRARENPYDIREQFRLIATDYEGTEWNCGWTSLNIKGMPKIDWPLTGKVRSLVTAASGPHVSTDSGVELVYQPKLNLPMGKMMTSTFSIEGQEIEQRRSPGEHTVNVLDFEVNFFHKPSEESLWITAKTSEKLTHPYAEHWIGEPLRILFGQLIFPCLVARNLGNGKAQVSVRRSPRRLNNSGIASLLGGSPLRAPARFWELYANLLKLVVDARDAKGQPNFEAHPITRFYEEIAQATQGSRWVLCMTLASAGEGIARLLMSPNDPKSDFTKGDIKSLRDHIELWDGNAKLKKRILAWFSRLGEQSASRFLWDLVKQDVLQESNAQAWSDVRHAVMHGKLVSPWATKEEDKRILELGDLVHRLTLELIKERAKSKEKPPPTSNDDLHGTTIPSPSTESGQDE